MGKKEVLDFLKKSENNFFSADEISKGLNVNLRSCSAVLKRLEGELTVRFVKGKRTDHKVKVYAFVRPDPFVDRVFLDLELAKKQDRLAYLSTDTALNVLVLAELKRLREVLGK